jgi:hypothetical protein
MADLKETIQALVTELADLSKTYEPGNDQMSEPEIVAKAKQIIVAAQTPYSHTLSMVTAMVQASTIRTLLSFNALQSIPANGSATLTDLESKTGAQKSLLERLLRVLVGTGFLKMNDDNTYSHTTSSQAYAGMSGSFFSAVFDEMSSIVLLRDYFKEKGMKEPDGEEAMTHNPDTWKHKQEGKTVFEILEQDPERLKNFHMLMGMVEMLRPYTGFYDYGKFASEDGRTAFVDIGGADGKTISRIIEAHPEIKPETCVLQDRKQVVELAHKSPNLPKGVEAQAHDFFQPQPVKGAKAYHLRAICHDWSDAMVIKILKNIVPAMAPDSRVLIADNVLPERGGSGMVAAMDMVRISGTTPRGTFANCAQQMMLCIGGKERTKANFEAVLDTAGLKLDGVYSAPGETVFSVVEASLK